MRVILNSLLEMTNMWPSDSGWNWNLEMLVFEEREKLEYPEKNLSEQGCEPTTNSTYKRRRARESNLGHICGRQVLSPLHHPYSPDCLTESAEV